MHTPRLSNCKIFSTVARPALSLFEDQIDVAESRLEFSWPKIKHITYKQNKSEKTMKNIYVQQLPW